MKRFDTQLLRLKDSLGVTSDQEVALLLGMTKAAFSDRKRRDSFPDDKLYALAARRPDLVIPVEYILSGETEMEHFKRVEGRAPTDYLELTQKMLGRSQADLTRDEQELLELFRAAPLKKKMQVVSILSGEDPGDDADKSSKVKVKGSGNRTSGRDYHE